MHVRSTVRSLLCLALFGAGVLLAGEGAPIVGWGGDGVTGPVPPWEARAAIAFPVEGKSLEVGNQPSADAGDLFVSAFIASGALETYVSTLPFVTSFEGWAIARAPEGRLFVGGEARIVGTTSIARGYVAALHADGFDLDPSWSSSGFEILDNAPFCLETHCRVRDLALANVPAGRLFALVESKVNALVSRWTIVAFDAAGAIDATFDGDGAREVTAPDLGTLAAGRAFLAVDAAGRPTVAAARFDPLQSLDADPLVARYLQNGAADGSLGPAGILLIDDAADEDIFAVGLASRPGRLVAAFAGTAAGGVAKSYFWRADPFNPSTSGHFSFRDLSAVAIQSDGKILFAFDATDDDDVIVRRVVATSGGLVRDGAFGPDGERRYDVDAGGSNEDRVTRIVVHPGAISLLGSAATIEGTGLFELRVEIGLLFADDFEGGSTAAW